MVKSARSASILVLVSALLSVLPSCGGGGGGGGGGGTSGSGSNISFVGFSFRAGDGTVSTTPPMEDTSTVPSTPGAGLNEVIIFHFSGVPDGTRAREVLGYEPRHPIDWSDITRAH